MSSKADRSEKRCTKAEKSWIMYDWANSIYATNIMAAIFPIYFAMQANETGNKLYGFAVSAAALVVAVVLAYFGKSLIVVALSSSAAVLVVQQIVNLIG